MKATRYWVSYLIISVACADLVAEGKSATWTTSDHAFRQSPLSAALDIQYVPIQYPNFEWSSGQSNQSGHALRLSSEWLPLPRAYGKLGVGIGAGIGQVNYAYTAQHFFALRTFPIDLFLGYRFDYLENQILVPFAKVGINCTLSHQRGDGAAPGTATYWGANYALGGELALSAIDKHTARTMDNRYGINAVYFVFEYYKSSFLGRSKAPNLAHNELRFGLRFEM